MTRGAKIIAGTVIFILVLMALIFYRVDVKEYVIVTQFGRPVKTIREPGLYWKWPDPIQTVNRFDRRLQVYETRLIEYLTEDKKNIVVQCFVGWKIENPLKFFQAVGSVMMAWQKIDDIVCSQLGAVLGDYPMAAIISTDEEEVKIGEMEARMTEGANSKTSENYGIQIKEIGICRLALPEDNAQAVYRRMKEERRSIANKYRAEGKEKATEIRAAADRQKSDILARAYRDAQVTMGEGDAEAIKIYAEAFEKDPEFYKFLRTLESYKKILNKKTTVVLSSDSDLLRYLNNKEIK
ncbi:MAG: protease modulator HflC [Nitrospirae bacterium]|nr:protease modulator HflC [Nitrospirota bacterium]